MRLCIIVTMLVVVAIGCREKPNDGAVRIEGAPTPYTPPTIGPSPVPYEEFGVWVNDRIGGNGKRPYNADVRLVTIAAPPPPTPLFRSFAKWLRLRYPDEKVEIFVKSSGASIYAQALRQHVTSKLTAEMDSDHVGSVWPSITADGPQWMFTDLTAQSDAEFKL